MTNARNTVDGTEQYRLQRKLSCRTAGKRKLDGLAEGHQRAQYTCCSGMSHDQHVMCSLGCASRIMMLRWGSCSARQAPNTSNQATHTLTPSRAKKQNLGAPAQDSSGRSKIQTAGCKTTTLQTGPDGCLTTTVATPRLRSASTSQLIANQTSRSPTITSHSKRNLSTNIQRVTACHGHSLHPSSALRRSSLTQATSLQGARSKLSLPLASLGI